LLELDIGDLLTEGASEFLDSSSLHIYRQYLTRILRKHQYRLSVTEEELSNTKDLFGSTEWGNLAQVWKNSKQFPLNIEGEQKTITWGESLSYFSNTNRDIRKEAILQIFNTFSEDEALYSSCFRNIFANYSMMANKRGCTSPLTLTLVEDDVTHPIISNMIAAIDKNIPLFHEVLQLKTQLLGLEQLQGEDVSEIPIYAPVPFQNTYEYPWEEAKNLILEVYSEFDDELTSILEELFTSNRINASSRGSLGVCFPWLSEKSAFVKVNFKGTTNDLFILAHELGHSIHSSLSAREQGYLNFVASFALIETASEFSTKLLTQKFLQKNLPKDAIASILLNSLESQLMFIFIYGALRFRFQVNVHKAIKAGEYLSAEKITELYKNARSYYYGDTVEFHPNQDKYWTFITAFYHPWRHYYNYQYAFGQLFVQILFAKYRENKESFIPHYKALLKAGCSQPPDKLMKLFGLELNDPSIWDTAFKELQRMIEELKRLIVRNQ
jgi:oligoendopeptidase F